MKHPKNYFLTNEGKSPSFSQIKKVCKTCGEEFMVQKHREGKAQFCSKKCVKGYKLSEETKKKMSDSKKREKHWNFGKTYSPEFRLKLSNSHIGISVGSKGSNWQGGKTSLNKRLRQTSIYRKWREEVFKRDNHTCVGRECGKYGGYIHADHIKPLSVLMKENNIVSFEQAMDCDALWEVSNGRTLCIPCHAETPSFPKGLTTTYHIQKSTRIIK